MRNFPPQRASAFIDLVENKVDQEAGSLLSHFRDELAVARLERCGGVCKRYTVDWVGREGLSPDTHQAYLTDFVNHFYKNVVKMIDRAMRKENVNVSTPLVYEILYHLHECKKSATNFFDREMELRKMRSYIEGEENQPFFIFGKGGSGKTALMSKVCHLIKTDWYKKGK